MGRVPIRSNRRGVKMAWALARSWPSLFTSSVPHPSTGRSKSGAAADRGLARLSESTISPITRALLLPLNEQRDAVSALDDVLSEARTRRLVADEPVDHGADIWLCK